MRAESIEDHFECLALSNAARAQQATAHRAENWLDPRHVGVVSPDQTEQLASLRGAHASADGSVYEAASVLLDEPRSFERCRTPDRRHVDQYGIGPDAGEDTVGRHKHFFEGAAVRHACYDDVRVADAVSRRRRNPHSNRLQDVGLAERSIPRCHRESSSHSSRHRQAEVAQTEKCDPQGISAASELRRIRWLRA
jgi:hypothetical protein